MSQIDPKLGLPIGHTGKINSVRLDQNGKLILTSSEDGTARLFDMASRKELHVFKNPSGAVYHAVISPDGQHAALACGFEGVKIFDIETGKILNKLDSVYFALSVEYNPEGTKLLVGGMGSIHLLDRFSGKILNHWTDYTEFKYKSVYSPDGNYFLQYGYQKVGLFNADNFEYLDYWDFLSDTIIDSTKRWEATGLTDIHGAFSEDGNWLMAIEGDGDLFIYDISARKKIVALTKTLSKISSASLNKEMTGIATDTEKGYIQNFELSS
jgi:WD40 repeat protein